MRGTQIHCLTERESAAEAEQSLVLPAEPSTCWYIKRHRRVWGFCTGNRSKVQEYAPSAAMGKTNSVFISIIKHLVFPQYKEKWFPAKELMGGKSGGVPAYLEMPLVFTYGRSLEGFLHRSSVVRSQILPLLQAYTHTYPFTHTHTQLRSHEWQFTMIFFICDVWLESDTSPYASCACLCMFQFTESCLSTKDQTSRVQENNLSVI